MLSMLQIEERLHSNLALFLEREAIRSSPALVPLASLKRKGDPSRFYGHGKDPSAGTKASRPSAMGGDGTQAGVKPKGVGGDGTQAGVKPKELTKTFASPAKRDREPTQSLPAAKKGGGEKPSCPGGGTPRMVFGKWRCTGGGSKGAEKGKSRLAAKRKARPKKPKLGKMSKLVLKAKKMLAQWFG